MSATRLQQAGDKPFDVQGTRADFPILSAQVRGHPLVYLDNAATSQKPLAVLEALDHFYRHENANVHRGVHQLSERATEAYEAARARVARFLNAPSSDEVVFVRGATEAINLVANSWGRPRLRAGDEIVLTEMEHHANIVPWQLLAEQTGAVVRVAPITDQGELDWEGFEALLGPRTRLVSVVHASNTLGTINPVERIVERAHRAGALVLVDGAQSAPHLPVDVRAIGCDFFAFSGHKAFGPTGIGALWGRHELLESMPPWQGGGDMILTVSFKKTTFKEPPGRFEAGTPHIAGAIGLAAALDYLETARAAGAFAYEDALLAYATERIGSLTGVRIVGTAARKVPVVSFVLDDVHPHDVGTILDQQGVAIRSGQHCTEPLLERLKLPATARASFAFYNTFEEVDRLVKAIQRVREVFA